MGEGSGLLIGVIGSGSGFVMGMVFTIGPVKGLMISDEFGVVAEEVDDDIGIEASVLDVWFEFGESFGGSVGDSVGGWVDEELPNVKEVVIELELELGLRVSIGKELFDENVLAIELEVCV